MRTMEYTMTDRLRQYRVPCLLLAAGGRLNHHTLTVQATTIHAALAEARRIAPPSLFSLSYPIPEQD